MYGYVLAVQPRCTYPLGPDARSPRSRNAPSEGASRGSDHPRLTRQVTRLAARSPNHLTTEPPNPMSKHDTLDTTVQIDDEDESTTTISIGEMLTFEVDHQRDELVVRRADPDVEPAEHDLRRLAEGDDERRVYVANSAYAWGLGFDETAAVSKMLGHFYKDADDYPETIEFSVAHCGEYRLGEPAGIDSTATRSWVDADRIHRIVTYEVDREALLRFKEQTASDIDYEDLVVDNETDRWSPYDDE